MSSAEPPPSEQEAPPAVVVVMVAHDPGPWWEEGLASLAAQTYPELAVFVVDTASVEPLDARLHAVLPAAHVHRLDDDPGFAAAADLALDAVEGAAFLLLCHDDIRLDPTAVQVMVEEAYRSNAGIVGPKLVDWDDPDRLLQVGMGADKFGAPAPVVERGELDQQQHDAVRDVFYVPGAATLVRADLFAALHGFDAGMELLGEDLDLCWRAHAVGARVLVAPAARVAHREALTERRPGDDRRRLAQRHRLRAVLADYRRFHRWRVAPQLFVLSLLEALFSAVLLRFGPARDVLGAWTWNLARTGELRRRRKALNAVRTVRDRDIRRLQVGGSARLSAFFRGQAGGGDDRLLSMVGAGRGLARTLRSPTARSSSLAWAAVLALFAFGSRDLLTAPIPAVGQLAPFPSHPLDVLRSWASGYAAPGLGGEVANPTANGLIGLLGLVFLGAMGQLRRVLILAMLPVGALGVWRLARPIGSRRSRIVALVVYAAAPVGINALAQARWDGLVAYALAPWVVHLLARASGVAPFGPVGDEPGPGVRPHPWPARVVALGLVTALGTAVIPSFPAVVLGVALALVVGGIVAGQPWGGLRMLGTAVGGVVVALVLHLPWSLTFVRAPWPQALGVSTVGRPVVTSGEIARFATGPAVTSVLLLALLVAAALALVIGKRWRLAWAVRGWTLALAGWAAVWVAAEGQLTGLVPHPEVLLAPAAVGIALAAALGMAAFEVDLPGYSIGWRQLASVAALAALVIGVLPSVAGTGDGAWGLPGGDTGQMLTRLQSDTDAYRMLWLGDADLLPVQGWPLDVASLGGGDSVHRLTYATTDGRTPSVLTNWPGTDQPASWRIAEALRSAADGGTDRLGSLLAPMGIEFVAVPDRLAPVPYLTEAEHRPDALLDVLAEQLDLARVEMPEGLVVYRNAAFGPTRARLAVDTPLPGGGPALADRTIPALAGAPVALPDQQGPTAFTGDVAGPARVYVAAGGDRWRLDVDGATPAAEPVLGWARAFTVDRSGAGSLAFDTDALRFGLLALQLALWVIAVWYLLRTRVVGEAARDRARVREARDL